MTETYHAALAALITLGVLLGGMIPTFGIVWARRRWVKSRERQSPLTRNMLRSPGHSLREALDEIGEETGIYLAFAFFLPVIAYAIYLTQSHFLSSAETVTRAVAVVLVVVGAQALSIRNLLKLSRRRRKLRGAYDCELATGEELNQLMLHGCRVFHDIPFPYGNIDHVVVSPSGVFTVNTKAVGKPADGDERARAIVDFQRQIIRFPSYNYPLPLAQLETEARWLSGHLKDAVGEAVRVEPMLALPGWFIERPRERGPVLVINPRNATKFFVQDRRSLPDRLMQQIAHQLEQLCRDVEPAYKREKRDLAAV
jgi:hypothetical protein